jgi:hypothetical protein
MRQSGSAPTFTARILGGPEPFILAAMASLAIGNIWMFRERELLLGHFYRPEFLSITHTLTLGWISMLMMGVLLRLGPRALGITPKSRILVLAQFFLMFVGTAGMVFHFWVSGFVAMASAAILIVIAASLQIWNFRGVFSRMGGPEWLPRYVAASMIHFLLAAVLGTLLGFNKVYNLLEGEFFPNIFAHAHLAALGWVTVMIIGFEHRLLPTSKPDSSAGSFWPALRFWTLEIGTLGLVSGLLLGQGWVPVFAGLVLASLWMHAWRPLLTLLRGNVQDRATLWASIALIFLVIDSIAGFLLSTGIPSPDSPLRMRVQLAYGYVGILGWITLTITAQVYKLFPMFVWEERFRSLWGKEPVPAMRDLYSTGLQSISNGSITIGVAAGAAGIVLNYLPVITLGQGIVVIGVVTFLMNLFLMARWALLRWPFRPTPQDWEHFRQNFPGARQ